ncbi:MAG TPA: hypothetical protein VJN21_13570 [Candidatus Acidoferrales bacterium]|nr:hypothetical protein [Candidatus Acidoferrales bacterium]
MSAETKKVLELLAAGKISAEDAERLLDKLSASSSSTDSGGRAGSAEASATEGTGDPAKAKKARYLRIQVEQPGKENVNMRVPLSFVRGGQLLSILPQRLTERLQEHGLGVGAFKFSKLNDPEFQGALDELNIDIDKGDGKKVRIFAE